MREETRRSRRRHRWLAGFAVLGVLLTVAALAYAGVDAGGLLPRETPASSTATPTTTTIPAACAAALALADDLATHGGMVADAGIDHGVLMEKLELFLDGKPGGLSGKEVYELGKRQVAVMEAHGPDVRATVRRFREARRRCPIK